MLDPVKNGCCVYDQATNQILVIGGWTAKKTTDAVMAYDPETQSCTFTGVNLPKCIEAHAVALVGQ